MYARRVNGEVLDFDHRGWLYEESFLFYDFKTDSLWVQATGEAERNETGKENAASHGGRCARAPGVGGKLALSSPIGPKVSSLRRGGGTMLG